MDVEADEEIGPFAVEQHTSLALLEEGGLCCS